jgi:hypothetical protein
MAAAMVDDMEAVEAEEEDLLQIEGGVQTAAPGFSTGQGLSSRTAAFPVYEFPSTLQDIILLPCQMKEPYALSRVPPQLRRAVERFLDWSSSPVNTERSAR